ncbi:MAG: DUF1559 domain-containing protein [Verrucomicrobiae bacterium]|nr:DUF1559 domain-containing protein [Verrucomicrobiae bacterium]
MKTQLSHKKTNDMAPASPPLAQNADHAMTLIELLTVTACIGLLCSLLLPALKSAREKARQIQCINNLRGIGQAAMVYANENESWLPHSGSAETTNGVRTWKTQIALSLGSSLLTSSKLEHGIFHCPSQSNSSCGSAAHGDGGFYGGYGWNARYAGYSDDWLSGQAPYVKLSQVAQPVNTILCGDTSDYYAGTTRYYRVFYLYNWAAAGEDALSVSARHHGGGNYLWIDGHVSWHERKETWANRADWFPIEK